LNRMTENTIEKFAIKPLEKQGSQYSYAPDVAPDVNQVSLPLEETEEGVIQ